MGNPTRLKNGVSVYGIGKELGNFPLPDPNYVCTYHNDFTNYVAGDWTVTADGGSTAVTLGTTYPGGDLVLTAATSGTKAVALATTPFRFKAATASAVGEQTWFKARILFDTTVTNPDVAIGLGTGGVATYGAATDGVYFTKTTGAPVAGTATSWSFIIKTASTATTVLLPLAAIPVISTNIDLAYYFDGKTFFIWVNGVMVGSYGTNGSLGTSLANLPASTVFLSPFVSNSWHTATSTVEVDYILAASELGR